MKIFAVSVIVPVYNLEAYVYRCINSLLMQTLKNIEIICINDGSEDGSLQILNNLAQKDKRIKIVNNDYNIGVAKSRNIGIEEALGEYLSFVDGDDFLDLDFLEKLYNKAKETESDIVKGGIKRVHIEGTEIDCSKNKEIFNAKSKGVFMPVYYQYGFGTSIYKKDFLSKYKLNFSNLSNGEDLIFLFKALSLTKKFDCVSNTYYNYYQRPTSLTYSCLKEDALSILKHFIYKFEYFNTLDITRHDYISFFKRNMFLAFEYYFQKFKDMAFDKDFYEEYVKGLIYIYKITKYKEKIFNKKKYKVFLDNEDIENYIKKVSSHHFGIYLFDSIPIIPLKTL